MRSPRRRSSAWICCALRKPGRLPRTEASASACRVPRTRVPRAQAALGGEFIVCAPWSPETETGGTALSLLSSVSGRVYVEYVSRYRLQPTPAQRAVLAEHCAH